MAQNFRLRWVTAGLWFSCLLSLFVKADSSAFENTAIVRTVELDGALTHITTRYSVRILKDGASEYTFSLGERDGELTSWYDANLKGKDELAVKAGGFDENSRTWSYTAVLPPGLKANANITIDFNTVQSNAAYAYPAMTAQVDPQSLKYTTDLFVISPYATVIQRTKIRTPTPQVHDYTQPSFVPEFTDDERSASKSGGTITYGPYNNIPASNSAGFAGSTQQRITIHYEIEVPVLRVISLRRSAEVSHWGSNLNIQDSIHLKNDGPVLKGHFSRIDHQIKTFRKLPNFGVLQSLTMYLPPGISSPYFYDLVGNVSTSRFRPTPKISSSKTHLSERFSVLELKPRYPLLGGWNYSFTLGWDAPLGDSARYDAANDRHILAVPFWTPVPGASVDDAEVAVILPEGATDIEIYEPFPMGSMERSTHVTYLDTIGRPSVIFRKERLTDRHTGNIYISYRVSLPAHLKKPVAVGTAMMGLFMLGLVAKRVDTRLQKSVKT